MNSSLSRTKVVATIGPASNSLEILRELVQAGMRVARLNFSHGSYDDHAKVVSRLRQVSEELEIPVTLLQDLQGPKIRVGRFPEGQLELIPGASVLLVPEAEYKSQEQTIPIDYPFLAEEAQPGAEVLLDDGLLELKITAIEGNQVECKVIEGGILKNRKGVNLPSLTLRLPSMTEKDKQDLVFGLKQGIDWVSLSFVRSSNDIITLREFLKEHQADDIQVMAKIEKPQAVENLEAIVDVCDGLMVARGDLGVEMSPERVPKLQKQIIRLCNQKGIPVITATQMLDSMIHNPRPTRAEASDVANAIMDGTDAVMLSGESAVGAYPLKAVEMLVKIARDTEQDAQFINYPPAEIDETHALSEALNTIDKILDLACIACFTTTGYTATLAAAERSKAPVVAFTPRDRVYHRLNLVWGVKPMLLENPEHSLEDLIVQINNQLLENGLAAPGDKILILGGSPVQKIRGTNFIKIHSIKG